MDKNPSFRFLFYVSQNYSFDVLRPLQTAARAAGHEVRWLVVGGASPSLLLSGETAVPDVPAAIAYAPHALFAPGDRAPAFLPGLKVQVFHGINEDKRGNQIPERGMFDLYCTQSASQSRMLQPLEARRGYFRVVETGWLKLDSILSYPAQEMVYERPQILYASTFTARLSSAEALYEEIRRLSQDKRWQWLVTLHPKMDPATVAKYRALENSNLAFFGTEHVIELLHRADVMVSDNSSILQEFLILNKPVVTFRNRAPRDCMIDIREPQQLERAIEQALAPGEDLRAAIRAYGPSITNLLDGAAAGRVLQATTEMLQSGWQDRKPINFLRNLKLRHELGYWHF
jgi:CDP-glycerol glycerophosphotransferase (TagB/SpsB family)